MEVIEVGPPESEFDDDGQGAGPVVWNERYEGGAFSGRLPFELHVPLNHPFELQAPLEEPGPPLDSARLEHQALDGEKAQFEQALEPQP